MYTHLYVYLYHTIAVLVVYEYRDVNLDLHPTSTRVPTTMVVVETMVETSPRGLAKARSTPE